MTEPAASKAVPTGDGRRALWSHVRALLVIVAVAAGVGVWLSRTPKDRDLDAAENIVRKASATPSTLKFFDSTVVIAEGDWRLVAVEFDEQNTFGAMIRQRGCVVFQWTNESSYRWNPFPSPVLPCDIELQKREDLRFLLDGQKALILRQDAGKGL